MPSFLATLAELLTRLGLDLGRVALGWARAMPVVVLVPAFGLKAIPAAARVVMALGLALAILPAMPPAAAVDVAWPLLLVQEIVRGLPLAVATAAPLWAATMAGGVVDALRGSASPASAAPTVEAGATPLGVPLSLLACAIFLGTGGPARVAMALVAPIPAHPAVAAVVELASGIELAVALAGPLLAASIVLEVSAALVARAASPAQLPMLLAPLRALGLLVVLGLSLERISRVLAAALGVAPL